MHILTFDIEDWYLSYHSSQIDTALWPSLESCTDRNTRIILSFLENYHLKATFFILGFEARQNPSLVRDIQRAGHDIGFHSVWHVPLFASTAQAFENDLKEGLALLEDILGEKVILYRAPMFSLDNRTPWAPEVLAANGIKVSSSVHTGIGFAGRRLPHTPFVWHTTSGQLIELPMPAWQLGIITLRVTGSGYFRTLPLSYLRVHALRNNYNMYYFHPRDFDHEVPNSPLLPAYRNVMSRLGNRSTQKKLADLIRFNTFVSVTQAVETLRLDELPVVSLLP